MAADLTNFQIGVNVYAFSEKYIDIASIGMWLFWLTLFQVKGTKSELLLWFIFTSRSTDNAFFHLILFCSMMYAANFMVGVTSSP